MVRIYKYEIIRRLKTIFVLCGVMLGMTIVSILLSVVFQLKINNMDSIFWFEDIVVSVWWSLTILALFFIPAVMFFNCSNAHIRELLYNNTNYLILTIPVPTWKILLGRWLAGLTEYCIYFFVSIICMFSWLTAIMPSFKASINFLKALFLNIFANPALFLVVIVYAFALFALIGMTIIMINILIRSFIKKRNMSMAIAIVLYIFLFFVLNEIALKLSSKLNWVLPINVNIFNYHDIESITILTRNETLNIPMVTPIIWLILSATFFGISAWLLEKKVEV